MMYWCQAGGTKLPISLVVFIITASNTISRDEFESITKEGKDFLMPQNATACFATSIFAIDIIRLCVWRNLIVGYVRIRSCFR